MYNTLAPVPSKAVKDLSDNTEVLDRFMNSTSPSEPDRFLVRKETLTGLRKMVKDFLESMGFEAIHLTYVNGSTLVVNRPTQLIDRAGITYAVKQPATFPLTLTGTWATDSARLVDVTASTFMSSLSASTGSSLIGFSQGSSASTQTIQTKLRQRLDVRDFGAVGDGVTDDTVAIQKALDAANPGLYLGAGKVFISPGSYLLTATLVAKPNTHIEGVHRIVSRLVRYTNYGDTLICGDSVIGAQGFQCTNIEFFHGGYFSGTEGTMPNFSTGAHITLRGSNQSVISGCMFYRMRYGVVYSGGYWAKLHSNNFYAVFDESVVANQEGFANVLFKLDTVYGHPVEFWIRENNFAGAKQLNYVGYNIVTSEGVRVTTLADGFEYGMAAANALEIRSLESALIAGNYFGERARNGILFSGEDRGGYPFNPLNIRIIGNIFDPCRGGQVAFVTDLNDCYSSGIIISDNNFIGRKCGFSAILNAPTPNNKPSVIGLTVTGNQASGHYGTPFIFDGAKGFTVTGNNISNYNSLNAASTDKGFVCAIAVRRYSSKGLLSSNSIGGGELFSDTHFCKEGIYFELPITGVVQSGNLRNGTVNWTGQVYLA